MSIGRLRQLLFLIGLAIAVLMAFRSQINRDQFFLLSLGWELVEHGRLHPFGPHVSGGGLYPGYLSGLLTGIPLLLWEDYRAPNFLVLLLCALFWLSPWPLFSAARLWAPNWAFLFGVAHLWTAYRQRKQPTFLDSFLHVLAIGANAQFHASFVLLAIVSTLLFFRGYIKVHWGGVAAAAATLLASVLPRDAAGGADHRVGSARQSLRTLCCWR